MSDKRKKLVVVGCGETAALADEYFTYDSEYEVCAFAVDSMFLKDDEYLGRPLISIEELVEKFPSSTYDAFVAAGYGKLNREREMLCCRIKSLGYKLASYISSRASVWCNATVGENCMILEGCSVQAFASVGDGVIMWTGARVCHRSIIKNFCFLATNVSVSGFCEIGERTFVGAGVAVADNVQIGSDDFIVVGSVVKKSIPNNIVCRGNPAVESPSVDALTYCGVSVSIKE